MASSKVPSPRFLGTRKVNLRATTSPMVMFRFFCFEKLTRGLLAPLAELGEFTEQDLLQFIGTKMMMGYLRLPSVSDYYRHDPILSTQISNLMEQRKFVQMESRLELTNQVFQNVFVNVKEEEEAKDYSDEFLKAASKKLNKKFQLALQPGQLLVLARNQSLSACTTKLELYQLLDKESNYVVQQFFWSLKEDKRTLQLRIMQLLANYAGMNHVIYVENNLLEIPTILQLYQRKICVATETASNGMFPSGPRRVYRHQGMFAITHRENVMFYPAFEYYQLHKPVLDNVAKHFLATEKHSIVPADGSHNVFALYFTLEAMINNCLALLPADPAKDHRLGLAQALLREPLKAPIIEPLLEERIKP
jgi:hypothetical protein